MSGNVGDGQRDFPGVRLRLSRGQRRRLPAPHGEPVVRTRRPLAAVLAGLLCTAAVMSTAMDVVAAEANVWVTPRGDSGATGFVPQSLPANLTLLWEQSTAEAIETTPIVGGDAVYVTDVMGSIEALDLATGQSRWRRDFETGFVASASLLIAEAIVSPQVDFPVLSTQGVAWTADQTQSLRQRLARSVTPLLVIGDVEGNVYGLDPATGESRWSAEVGGEIDGAASFYALVPAGGDASEAGNDDLAGSVRVLVTSQDGSLRCLSVEDGSTLWTYQTGDQIRCAASIGGGKTFLGGCDGGLHVVDLVTGEGVGEPFALGGPTGSTPAIDGEQVFLPTMDGLVYRFDLGEAPQRSGEPVWQYEDPDRPQEYRGDVAVGEDRIVIASKQRQVDALDRATGEPLWRTTLRRRADASPLIAGDDVWVASSDGRLVRLSLEDGTETWSFEIRGSFLAAPAIVGDRLIIADDEGVVRCFGPAKQP